MNAALSSDFVLFSGFCKQNRARYMNTHTHTAYQRLSRNTYSYLHTLVKVSRAAATFGRNYR